MPPSLATRSISCCRTTTRASGSNPRGRRRSSHTAFRACLLLSQQETDTLVAWAQKARPNHARIKNLISDLRMLDGVEGDTHLVDRSLEQTVKARSDTMEPT